MIYVRAPRPDRASRCGFTLAELLASITIIVILAATLLFGMAGVQNTAKTQRTKSEITRIHEMLVEKWESYETRRVPPSPPDLSLALRARDRLWKLRELLRMELPDRITDVTEPPQSGITLPSLALGYRAFVESKWGPGWATRDHGKSPPETWTYTHQGGECLYMILSRMEVGDGNGLEFFSENQIGDTDRDRLPEILDAWGNPITFIRWPTGFNSPLQQDADPSTLEFEPQPDSIDVFDLVRVDNGYFVFPLVLSAGPDQQDNIYEDLLVQYQSSTAVVNYAHTDELQDSAGANDPYALFPRASAPPWSGDQRQTIQLGAIENPNVDEHADNLHNHAISTAIR